MSEDWYDVVHLFRGRSILFGTRADRSEIERDLTADERVRVRALESRQSAAMHKLLRELAA